MGKEKILKEAARVSRIPNALAYLFNDNGFSLRGIASHEDENDRWCFVADFVSSKHYEQYKEEDFVKAFSPSNSCDNKNGGHFKLTTIDGKRAVVLLQNNSGCDTNEQQPGGSSEGATDRVAEVDSVTSMEQSPRPENEEKAVETTSSAKKKAKNSSNKQRDSSESDATEATKNCKGKDPAVSGKPVDESHMEKDDDEESWEGANRKATKGKKNKNKNEKTAAASDSSTGKRETSAVTAQGSEVEDMDTTELQKSSSSTEVTDSPSKNKKSSTPSIDTQKSSGQSKSQDTKKTDSDDKRKDGQSVVNDVADTNSIELTDKEATKLDKMLAFAFEKNGIKEKGVVILEDGSVELKDFLEKCTSTIKFTEAQVLHYISAASKSEYSCKITDGRQTIRYIPKQKPEVATASSAPGTSKDSARAGTSRGNQRQEPRAQTGRMNGSGNNDNKPYQQKPRESQDDFFLSKTMSYLLRHGAKKQRMPIADNGYMLVSDMLKYREFEGYYREEDVMRIVENNDKKRFELARDDSGILRVRANQGHTMEVKDLELKLVTDPNEIPIVIHGTYLQTWPAIRKEGLKRMGRNHIHFARGEPGNDDVISGMRASCEVMIYIDAGRAMNGGLQFFISANGVILCPGNKEGVLPAEYIAQAIQRNPRQRLQ